MQTFFEKNIRYPEAAAHAGIIGKVWVTFVINKDGSIEQEHVVRDIGGGCGEEALKAIKKRHTFRQGANFRPWIFAILRNTLADHFRRKKKQPITFSLDDETHDEYVTKEGPEGIFFDHILDEEIEQALSTLPKEMQMAILLVDVEGFGYQELAETLNWPLGTVMSRLYRGRRKLRTQLQKLAQRRGYAKQR